MQFRLKEVFNSDWPEVCGGWLEIVQPCVQFIKLVLLNVDEVEFIWWSIELELKASFVEENDKSFVTVIVRNPFNHGVQTR